MAELTGWQQKIKEAIQYEVYEFLNRLLKNGKATINHTFMCMEVEIEPLKISLPQGLTPFQDSLIPFLELIQEEIDKGEKGMVYMMTAKHIPFTAKEFDTQVLLSSFAGG